MIPLKNTMSIYFRKYVFENIIYEFAWEYFYKNFQKTFSLPKKFKYKLLFYNNYISKTLVRNKKRWFEGEKRDFYCIDDYFYVFG